MSIIISSNSFVSANNKVYKQSLPTNVKNIQADSNTCVKNAQCFSSHFYVSFGKFHKIGETIVTDKASGKKQKALIFSDKYGDFERVKLSIKGKEAGYIDLDFSQEEGRIPDDVLFKTNKATEVVHLCSTMGDEYTGIGTALMKIAFLESVKNGCGGALWLNAEKGYARGITGHRTLESPVPFYYKFGMRATNSVTDRIINDCIRSSDFENLPDKINLYLTEKSIEKLFDELISNNENN